MSEQYVSMRVFNQMQQILNGLASGGFDEAEVRAALQAIIEKKPVGESSRDDRFVGYWDNVSFTERQLREDRLYLGKQILRRHRNGGGWVPLEQSEYDQTKPFVAESALIGPFAFVLGNARVVDTARILGCAVARGNASVRNSACVREYAVVESFAEIFDNGRVSQHARVGGRAMVYEGGCVGGDAVVFGRTRVHGDAVVVGNSRFNGASDLSTGRHVDDTK